ncbi:MAG: Frizzy aggregation protein FrzB [Myxococcales bacterium]|nr:Frizzy aggregation protein FrzB [Myxococcales bacterium]
MRADEEIDLLLFEVGGELYGAEASQVQRIERVRGSPRPNSLGRAADGARSLAVGASEGGDRVDVDLVLGIVTVSAGALRRVPLAARPRPYAIGLWLDRERPVVLIDLPEVITNPSPISGDATRKPE